MVRRAADLRVLAQVQGGPAPLGQRAEGGGLRAGLAPQGSHRLQGRLPVDAEEGASVETHLVAQGVVGLRGVGPLLGASGDPGGGLAPRRPGQQHVDQSAQQQAHKHGQTEG